MINTKNQFVFVNGNIMPSEEAQISIHDIALLRGYGVFDFFRAIDGKPIFLDDYLDRFERSLAGMHLSCPYSRDFLKQNIYKLIDLHDEHLLGIRMVCTGGYADDVYTPTKGNVMMIARPFQFHPYDKGLHLMTVAHQRELHNVKSINYITPISLLPTLKSIGADDVLYHKDGYVTESSRSNIFIIKSGVLITPDSGMLEGITRKRIISICQEVMPIEIRPVTLQEVYDADELFLSASTKRISPITQIDHVRYESGPFTKKLYDLLLVEEQEN
jgi:D-alanine transaminase/branched-chain amino acid aminotransferase